MLQRIRDHVKAFKPQEQITYEEWTFISDRAISAKKFLDENNQVYVMLAQSLKDAESTVLENRVLEVREERTVSELFKKVFIYPKQMQLDELVGQIKLIRNLFRECQSWIDMKKMYEKQEANGKITIDHGR